MKLRIPQRRRTERLLADDTFQRGLALGALIGAAIAGSTLWSRLRRPASPDESERDVSGPSASPPA